MKKYILVMAAASLLGLALNATAADPKAAADKARTLCAGCHGPNGISVNPLWPNLAGQHAAYLAKSIRDYRTGARGDPVMTSIASTLSDQEIEDVAAWYAAQPPGG